MYAIRNKKTKKWVYGTDSRYYPEHQRTSYDKALLFSDEYVELGYIETELKSRGINLKTYEVVKVKLIEY